MLDKFESIGLLFLATASFTGLIGVFAVIVSFLYF